MTRSPSHAYLDWNATAPLLPMARTAIIDALDLVGNPSSVHGPGRAARSVLEVARAKILAAVHAHQANLIFTSGGTEANSLSLRGLVHAAAARGERITRLIVSAIEHDSILQTARMLEADVPGLRLTQIGALPSGIIDLDALKGALLEGKGRAIVALMLANNETGVIQPVGDATTIAKSHGALVVCDGVQAFGKIAIDFAALGIDVLTLSAHKVGGPKGIGAVVVREGLGIAPQLFGGGQEFGLRAGTQNVAAAAGFGAVAALNVNDWLALKGKRDALESALVSATPAARIYGHQSLRLANTLCIGMPGVPSETQIMTLDLDGVAVSAGAACSSGKVKPSHVLTAIGATPEQASQAIRISFGPTTSDEEIARLIKSWSALARRAAAAPAIERKASPSVMGERAHG